MLLWAEGEDADVALTAADVKGAADEMNSKSGEHTVVCTKTKMSTNFLMD